MVEALVTMVLIGIACLGFVLSQSTAIRIAKMTEAHYAASSLAASKVEMLASIDSSELDSTYNETAALVTWPGLNNVVFTRTTTITVHADNSKTINVTVDSSNTNIPAHVNFVTTFATWE